MGKIDPKTPAPQRDTPPSKPTTAQTTAQTNGSKPAPVITDYASL